MAFELDLNSLVTTITALGLVGAFRMLLSVKSKVDVLESHKINTEEMRRIMENVQKPLVVEVHHLRDEVEAMRTQLAGRRNTD